MEKVAKKKTRGGLSPKARLLALLCACAVVSAAVFFLRSWKRLPAMPPGEETVLLLPRPATEAVSVTVAGMDSPPYTLVQRDGAFVLKGQENVTLKESWAEEFRLSVGKVPAETVVLPQLDEDKGVGPAAFGLDPAQARVTVAYQDGESVTLLLGGVAPIPETPQRYCMLAGDPRLFTVLEADCEVFFHEEAYLRDFRQPKLDGSLLDRIEVTGDVEWTARYTPTGWQMEAPFVYPLSVQRMEAMLSRIEYMGFEACLGSEEEVDLAAYGLLRPAVTVHLTQAATVISGETAEGEQVSFPMEEKVYTLQLGNETGKSGVYLLWEGMVYKASNFLLGFWKTLNPRELVLANPVNFLVNNLDEVTLTASGVSHTYTVRMVESITENNQIAVDEYGRPLYDLAVRRAGETHDMDAGAFAAWYTQLATLSGDGALPADFQLTGESRASILLKNSHLTRLIEFYPFDALHDALAVDGVALFYVQKTWLDQAAQPP